MPRTSIKGYAFEYFVRSLVSKCGFHEVVPDGTIVYENTTGKMIHGLGQPHNADVLVSPPIQIPFYFPTRLLIECKCYDEQLGIEFGRNVLGLREDINAFDIVTPEILNNRKNYRRKNAELYKFERHIYQVALASLSGFKYTTQEFATVHRIPLISFAKSTWFEPIRQIINEFDQLYDRIPEIYRKDLMDILKGYKDYYRHANEEIRAETHNFFEEVDRISSHTNIGILENGTILFMYKQSRDLYVDEDNIQVDEEDEADNIQDDEGGFRIYWADNKRSWRIEYNQDDYYFELPDQLLKEWDAEVGNWDNEYSMRRNTIDFKENYFPKVILYEYNIERGKADIKIIEISKKFLKRAAERIENQFREE